MKLLLLLPVLLSLASPVAATDLDFQAVTGGELTLNGEIGFGNWITSTLYEYGVLQPDERRLDSFTFFLTNKGTDSLTFRAAVGLLDGIALAGDAFTTADITLEGGGSHIVETIIPGGLFLDPAKQYMPYILPVGALNDAYQWTIATTLTNRYPGIVGSSPQMYSFTHQVDLDLPFDQDVAMQARITSVPEPSTLLLTAAGFFVAANMWRRFRR